MALTSSSISACQLSDEVVDLVAQKRQITDFLRNNRKTQVNYVIDYGIQAYLLSRKQ